MKDDEAAVAAAAARAEVFDAIGREMELADYATADTGHKVRRVPRAQRSKRKAKEMELNRADMMEMAIEASDDEGGEDGEARGGKKRLRGTRVAFDDVVLKSMPLATGRIQSEDEDDKVTNRNEEGEDESFDLVGNESYEVLQEEVATLGIDLDAGEMDNVDEFEEGDDEEFSLEDGEAEDQENDSGSDNVESDGEKDEAEAKAESKGTDGKGKGPQDGNERSAKPTASSKRVMHRLRDFTSQRLADKHAEAIGAHIRGMSETAVQKLREVARAAPGAPQVYSSLGMVFESMLTEMEGDHTSGKVRREELHSRMELAQKAYASFHVAALLCRRDFTLWERSGDAAARVAQIYTDIISDAANAPARITIAFRKSASRDGTATIKGFDPNAGPEIWRSDRESWLDHALQAYKASDNLRPPGIDIPCKLAKVHMSVGNYMEALAILTGLRNMASGQPSASTMPGRELGRLEMEGSYPCWLLYADLALKIGYECQQWERGLSVNKKYTFKRWLRKHSRSFNWQERRLQSLCLALEAAAGSSACVKLIEWMKERAEKVLTDTEDIDAKEVTDKASGANEDEIVDATKVTVEAGVDNEEEVLHAKEVTDASGGNESHSTTRRYGEEIEKLARINATELSQFDRMTKDMNLVPGSHMHNNRIAARTALIAKHRTAIKELAMHNFADGEHGATSVEPSNAPLRRSDAASPLPIQGSFATVYDISALLLRQCIQLQLYEGGVLTVQSVLEYQKDRVSRQEKKVMQQRANETKRNSLDVQLCWKHDQINFDSDDSDDERDDALLSDDEDLEIPGAILSFKQGRLPEDIGSMHAICLLGMGGKDYSALNCLDRALRSTELDLFDKDRTGDADIVGDRRWAAFAKHFKAPTDKAFLLASVADLVTKTTKGRPQCWLPRMLGIFKHVFKLIDSHEGHDMDQVMSSSDELRRSQTMKILLAAVKLLNDCARKDVATLESPGIDEVETAKRGIRSSTHALNIMARYQYVLWNPIYMDWSLPQQSIDFVSILSATIDTLLQAATIVATKSEENELVKSKHLGEIVALAKKILSKICQATIGTKEGTYKSPLSPSVFFAGRTFPLPCSWQSSFHEKISLRAYNLCVACCVSSFSGWEPSEFSLDNLRSTAPINFFGVTLEGPSVAGFLPDAVAYMIAEQWDYIQTTIIPDMEMLPFVAYLDERKKMSWYRKVMNNIDRRRVDTSKISHFGEAYGIKALLSFSMMCLLMAESTEGYERDEMIKLSLSVLLPMTQFSIDMPVWQSKIGTAVISGKSECKVGYYLDENNSWMGPRKTNEGHISDTTKKRAPQPRKAAKTARKRNEESDVVKVPASILLDEWRKDSPFRSHVPINPDSRAKSQMKMVDDAMRNLHESRTVSSLERASIDVSAALLALVAFEECYDPFMCLQQAACFAAMGSKRGNNDVPFKRVLPLKNQCSPLVALSVLGRADCLRAIHFLHEAQYLCSWVASVCASHRNQSNDDLPWNSRWKIVGVVAYTVSSAIERTGQSLAEDDPSMTLRKWHDNAKAEFSRGESDALVLVSMNPFEVEPANETDACESNVMEDIFEQLEPDEANPQNNAQSDVESDDFANVEVVGV